MRMANSGSSAKSEAALFGPPKRPEWSDTNCATPNRQNWNQSRGMKNVRVVNRSLYMDFKNITYSSFCNGL